MNVKNSYKNRIVVLTLISSLSLVFSNCKKDSLDQSLIDVPPITLLTDSTTVTDSTAGGTSVIPGDLKSTGLAADGITSSSYYLVNSLPSGYVKDGSRDYTSYVQAAVSKYSNIVFPAFPIMVSYKGITIGSNKVITFPSGSQIRLKGSSYSAYNILKIAGASNITLYNPVIIGDRSSHSGTGGESGMGIGIRGSSNITIYNAQVSNCWGDGIYIGQTGGSVNCKDIVIKGATLKKNRRDGISIIGVDGLLMDNVYAGYSDGTSPMSGINFEPNNTSCQIKNVLVNNPRTEYNGANGIQIGTKNMIGSTNKTSDITVINHVDVGSPRYAFKMMCNPTTSGKQYGLISVVNPTWNKTETGQPLYLSSNQANWKTVVSSPAVTKTSGTTLSYSSLYTLLMEQASRAKLTVNNETSTVSSTSTSTATTGSTSSAVVFAVNAGGPAFTASNGITYSADKNYNDGSIYEADYSVTNTPDDVLYRSERYGNFGYSIPLADGTYQITFKTAEIFHKAAGERRFDILAEGSSILSNLDIYSVAGFSKAYDIVKTVTVTDGTLNLSFRTDIDNAKISAFHIIKT